MDILPTQVGNSSKYLTTNGSNLSWASVTGGGISIDDNTVSSATTYSSQKISSAYIPTSKLVSSTSTDSSQLYNTIFINGINTTVSGKIDTAKMVSSFSTDSTQFYNTIFMNNKIDTGKLVSSVSTDSTQFYNSIFMNTTLSNKVDASKMVTNTSTDASQFYNATFVNAAISNKISTNKIVSSVSSDPSEIYNIAYVNTKINSKQDSLPALSSSKFLYNDGTTISWEAVPANVSEIDDSTTSSTSNYSSNKIHTLLSSKQDLLPALSTSKFLYNDGTTISWAAVPASVSEIDDTSAAPGITTGVFSSNKIYSLLVSLADGVDLSKLNKSHVLTTTNTSNPHVDDVYSAANINTKESQHNTRHTNLETKTTDISFSSSTTSVANTLEVLGDLKTTGTSSALPSLILNNTSSLGNLDDVGVINFRGNNASGNQKNFGRLYNYARTSTNGSEESVFMVETMQAGVIDRTAASISALDGIWSHPGQFVVYHPQTVNRNTTDGIGSLSYATRNHNSSNDFHFAKINGYILNNANGTEAGSLGIRISKAGSLQPVVFFGSDSSLTATTEVANFYGKIKLNADNGSNHGIVFSDGTVQNTAAVSSSGSGPTWTDHPVSGLTNTSNIGYNNKNGTLWGNRGKAHWFVEDHMFEQAHYNNVAHARVINGSRHGIVLVDGVTSDGAFPYHLRYGGYLTLQPQEKHRYNFSQFYATNGNGSTPQNYTTKFRVSASNDGFTWDTLTEFQMNSMTLGNRTGSDPGINGSTHGKMFYTNLYSNWNGTSGSILNTNYYHAWRITLTDQGNAPLVNDPQSGQYYKSINVNYFMAEIEFG